MCLAPKQHIQTPHPLHTGTLVTYPMGAYMLFGALACAANAGLGANGAPCTNGPMAVSALLHGPDEEAAGMHLLWEGLYAYAFNSSRCMERPV